jgi:hypothetical protein
LRLKPIEDCSVGYTSAPKAIQPTVKNSGIGKAYCVCGLPGCFAGKLYVQGLDGKFTSETYHAFLEWAFTQITGHMILIQDNASYHTCSPLQCFNAAHTDRLAIYRLSSYSSDLNPIESLGGK